MKQILTTVIVALGMLTLTATGAVAAPAGIVPERSHVCMMQDTLLKTPGIPIRHAGKTYFGCCPMCNEKITSEPGRYTVAEEPVSGRRWTKRSPSYLASATPCSSSSR